MKDSFLRSIGLFVAFAVPLFVYGQNHEMSLLYEAEPGGEDGTFERIRQVTLGLDDSLYILESNKRLSKLSKDGEPIFNHLLVHSDFTEYYSIDSFRVDPSGNVFVRVNGLPYKGGTYKLLADGSLLLTNFLDDVDLKKSVQDIAGNTYYVVDTQNGPSVIKIDSEGEREEILIDSALLPNNTFARDLDISTVDQFSNLYFLVQDHVPSNEGLSILKMNSEGEFVSLDKLLVHGPDYEIPAIRSLSVNNFGELFLLDNTFSNALRGSKDENWRVFKWSPPGFFQQILDVSGDGSGEVQTTTTGSFGHYNYTFDINGNPLVHPYDSVTDSLGNVYVIARTSHKLFKVWRDGTVELIVNGSTESSNSEFSYPSQLEIDSEGNLYVLTVGNGRDKIFKITNPSISSISKHLAAQLSDRTTQSFSADSTIEYGDATLNELGQVDSKHILFGLAGDDGLHVGARYSYLFGGGGSDTALYKYDRYDYALSQNPLTGDIEVVSKNGDATALIFGDVETHQFRDQSISNSDVGYWGKSSIPSSAIEQPIFRFFNAKNNSFFYTSNASEAEHILERSSELQNSDAEWSYVYQGATFSAAHNYPDAVYVHRFYNTKTGHHFFTVNEDEIEYIKHQIAQANWSFEYEGTAFKVYPWDPNESAQGLEVPVHRFYSSVYNRHVFTASPSEALLFNESKEWNYEGIAFYGERAQ